MKTEPIDILMAEDDPDDRLLVTEAFEQAEVRSRLTIVGDGEELMDYLRRRGSHGDALRPDILLLDLNMPRKDGREALREIKGDPALRRLPVVAMTTSNSVEDILQSYDLGVNSYIRKPVSFHKLVEVIRVLCNYWDGTAVLPPVIG